MPPHCTNRGLKLTEERLKANEKMKRKRIRWYKKYVLHEDGLRKLLVEDRALSQIPRGW